MMANSGTEKEPYTHTTKMRGARHLAKNKYIAGILVMLLLLTGCGVSPAEGGETESPSPSPSASAPADPDGPVPSDPPAYYAAYAEIVRDYQRQYGPERIQQIYSQPDMLNYLMGVCVVRLADFDLDGTPELLLAWPESETAFHSYRYAIWTSPDGQAAEKICENKILDGVQSYCPFFELARRADGVFLGEDISVQEVSDAHVYRGVSPSGLVDVLTLGYDPYGGDDGLYRVNGRSVGGDDYNKARSDFLEGAEVERISFALADFEDSTPLVEAVRATQEALLLLGVEPNKTGRDIASPSPEQTGYAPYLELVDQYLSDYGQPHILTSSRYDGGDEMPALGGLCVVRLLDMDQDGSEELVLVYPWKESIGEGKHLAYQYSIWAMQDGKAVELYANTLPATAYEPSMALFVGSERSYLNFSYDTNTEQATSIANVEFASECHTFDGESLIKLAYEDIPRDAVNNGEAERIYFSANSYRWAAGMDWDTDSQRVVSKTVDTINLLRSASN